MSGNIHRPDEQAIAYRLPQAPDMMRDLVHPGAATDWLADDKLWVPSSSTVSFKPLLLCASQGYYINLLRVRGSGVVSRHRHTGPVHAMVLKGRWYYLEHDWVAEQGGYAFEPAGETHTLYVPEDVPEMITWFHVTGGYTYVDPEGVAQGYEDVFTKIETARRHYQSLGLPDDYIKQFIR
ncbi:2,4'-dihydroxyacetophenone dioxygenase family protein [Bordetella pseudohinzii]|uniref:Cupin n=1 Tax=Bordetella pseudohinzii TaxID=1331258 RepID=A0A0J6BSF1_9BORD|nr:2,4'-dihydroxyacetophenone dioxygenase family protein [Bordetella pseudohinzii]ANY17664.1 cupin [Bordetella pseudohinzii]KMM24739.1 cupin [Bordetella pseudohinzii]KXA76913.1 cupin [Bordetella pseudohinzii]KXA77225.1 cupin [Bordetella pseudohinzii]CUJ01143.1 ChrR Cupin-like domain [Bordetella pseudohinzii]